MYSMRTVIGEYESLALATSAVSALESQISIQGIVIADQTNQTWRKRDPQRDRRQRPPHAGFNFLVTMSGTARDIERARALLHAPTAR
jgi:hypothetical protein